MKKFIASRNNIYNQQRWGGPNHNCIIMGDPGSGKTRSVVIPNILNANHSMVIADSKGALYDRYREHFESKGYIVRLIDFVNPKRSDHYNIFLEAQTETDIYKLAHMLSNSCYNKSNHRIDPFWDQATEIFMTAIIAYMKEFVPEEKQNIRTFMDIATLASKKFYLGIEINLPWEVSKDSLSEIEEDKIRDILTPFSPKNDRDTTMFDYIFAMAEVKKPNTLCVRQYNKFRTCPGKTWGTIITTTFAKLGMYDTIELCELMSGNDFKLSSVGDQKTVVFVSVSDSERSMDILANIFYTQMLNALCEHADRDFVDHRLPIDVQFVFDDFATNVTINDFPRSIAAFRSRGISFMLLLQAEGQLSALYGKEDADTIINSCSTYIYLGGNDVDTSKAISERANMPLEKIMRLPYGKCIIFRRSEAPVFDDVFDTEELEHELELYSSLSA